MLLLVHRHPCVEHVVVLYGGVIVSLSVFRVCCVLCQVSWVFLLFGKNDTLCGCIFQRKKKWPLPYDGIVPALFTLLLQSRIGGSYFM